MTEFLFVSDLTTTPSPNLILLEQVFSNFSSQQKIEYITSAIIMAMTPAYQKEMSDIEICSFFKVLIKTFGNDKVALRLHIRENIYPKIPVFASGGERLPKTRQLVLQEILKGWSWIRGIETDRLWPDAGDCFKFICTVFASSYNDLRKMILEIFRTHLQNTWRPLELDAWILSKKTPPDIKLVLLKARTVLLGVDGVKEIEYLSHLDPLKYSREAIKIAQDYIDKVAKTEKIAMALIQSIVEMTNSNYFILDLNKKIVVGIFTISYAIISENKAEITIQIKRQYSVQQIDCQEVLAKILKAREELFSKIEQPPKIIISVSGPDNFKFEQEETV